MSAIAGIYYLDGRIADSAALERMSAALSHRGPDASGVWTEKHAGMIHRMLWTTPESLVETLPLTSACRRFVITAEARIDNRGELLAALGFAGQTNREIADSEIILAAYQKWGDRCPEHLLGDFAFAIWDNQNQTLFCARDHFGAKPFYYYSSSRIFAFASEIKGLLCLPDVPREINEIRVADYLASMHEDTTATFYSNILRLPPAHCATVSREGVRLRRYWSLDASREVRLGSDEEYAEAFRELFFESVRCRLRSAFPIGSELSGGLDSSSVTSTAYTLLSQDEDKTLTTFSAVYDKVSECDERPFINAVIDGKHVKSHYFAGDSVGPLTDIDRMLRYQDEPFFAPHLFVSWALNAKIHEQGIRVLLDGFDGDSVLSYGFGYLRELAQGGHWLNLAEELRGHSRLYGTSSLTNMWKFAWRYRVDPVLSRYRGSRAVRRTWRAMARGVRINRQGSRNGNRPGWISLLDQDFVTRTDLMERYRAQRSSQSNAAKTEREEHYSKINAGLQPFALEVLDRSTAASGIEVRHPFWDKRLVEFCLALPAKQKLRGGLGRLVLRQAMVNILPEEVRWRPDKINFSPNLVHGLLTYERERLDTLVHDELACIADYLNVDVVRESYRRFLSQGSEADPANVFAIWNIVALAIWHQRANVTTQEPLASIRQQI